MNFCGLAILCIRGSQLSETIMGLNTDDIIAHHSHRDDKSHQQTTNNL